MIRKLKKNLSLCELAERVLSLSAIGRPGAAHTGKEEFTNVTRTQIR
jgi:hypothetical protein